MNIMPQEVSDLLNGLTEPQSAVRCWACHRFMPASVGYGNAPCEPCQRRAEVLDAYQANRAEVLAIYQANRAAVAADYEANRADAASDYHRWDRKE